MEIETNYLFFQFLLFSMIGEVQLSTYPGRVIVTEPKGLVQPRINVEKHASRQVVLNGHITLPCIAQGHPPPTYRCVLKIIVSYKILNMRKVF